MRIWGYVLLVIGILFLILFGLAALGGGHIGVLPFFIAIILIASGWKLALFGKGIVPANPPTAVSLSAQAVSASGQSVAPPERSATVEMPLTPQIADLLVSQNARTQRTLLYVVGAILIFFVGLGIVLGATDTTPGEGRTLGNLFAGIGLVSAILIYGISWLTTQKPVRRDLQGTSYLRTSGPMQVVVMAGGAMLRLADRAFLMNGRNGIAELSKLSWAIMDYTPHGHLILGAWDRDGKSAYRVPGYTMERGAEDPIQRSSSV